MHTNQTDQLTNSLLHQSVILLSMADRFSGPHFKLVKKFHIKLALNQEDKINVHDCKNTVGECQSKSPL